MVAAERGRIATFRADLRVQLQSGAHLVLYGPRGTGKSTTLGFLEEACHSRSIPCGGSLQTSSLSDIVAALILAYPHANIAGFGRRAAGIQLRVLAARVPGVILLDHATDLTTAMIGFLRRLRGGIAGVLLIADIDSDRERDRLRAWRRHAVFVRMPLYSVGQLRQIVQSRCSAGGLPALESRVVRQIVRAARGRVGWVDECIRRLHMQEYWAGGRLHLAALCTDSEIALRTSRRGPRMRDFS